ncbi:basic proline-rich protein-like [Calypte anna]|uniref:basic proline-rich protein-like n=1 Tax=Calypte anna TaxID=9244 RepID=UPI0011C4045E|nr:basic proline-rich protein-like [Calypte anna]
MELGPSPGKIEPEEVRAVPARPPPPQRSPRRTSRAVGAQTRPTYPKGPGREPREEVGEAVPVPPGHRQRGPASPYPGREPRPRRSPERFPPPGRARHSRSWYASRCGAGAAGGGWDRSAGQQRLHPAPAAAAGVKFQPPSPDRRGGQRHRDPNPHRHQDKISTGTATHTAAAPGLRSAHAVGPPRDSSHCPASISIGSEPPPSSRGLESRLERHRDPPQHPSPPSPPARWPSPGPADTSWHRRADGHAARTDERTERRTNSP